jgi:hypothetical protein
MSVQENGGMMNKEMVTGMQVLSTDSAWNGISVVGKGQANGILWL